MWPSLEIELGYFAGFLDGEGCFWLDGCPRIAVSNTYPAILTRLQRRFGGTVRKMSNSNPRARPCFQWYISGAGALYICRTLAPYLVEKRRQAELLQRWDLYPPNSAMRRALIAELKASKRIPYEQNNTSC